MSHERTAAVERATHERRRFEMCKMISMLLLGATVVTGMAFSGASACDAGTVGDQVFATAGGDPSGGQIDDALNQADAALAPVEAETGQSIPLC
jgi:hypothetical protein